MVWLCKKIIYKKFWRVFDSVSEKKEEKPIFKQRNKMYVTFSPPNSKQRIETIYAAKNNKFKIDSYVKCCTEFKDKKQENK